MNHIGGNELDIPEQDASIGKLERLTKWRTVLRTEINQRRGTSPFISTLVFVHKLVTVT